jgi:hypothetical protein
VEALAATAISLVAPYLVKGAEEFAKQTGQQAAIAVASVVERLQKWWSGKPVAAAAAENLPDDPEQNSKFLGEVLARDLADDPEFAAELRTLVDEVAPSIEIIQRIEIAKGVTGADVDDLVKGTVRVEQHVSEAENVIGFRGRSVGR